MYGVCTRNPDDADFPEFDRAPVPSQILDDVPATLVLQELENIALG